MDGTILITELTKRLDERGENGKISDTVLARYLGITPATLASFKGKELTARQICNVIDSYAQARVAELVDKSVEPIIEFLQLVPCQTTTRKSWQLFSTLRNGKPNRYLKALRERLEGSHGIYVFHDSRGRAMYVGKAQQLTLWTEMNNAFNRDRKEVQNIKRVTHPISQGGYAARERQIVKRPVALHAMASYVSAYEVPDELISKFEALLVRSFANDLSNVRMEHF